MCWRNGVKSEPEPRAPMRRSLRARASLRSSGVPFRMRAARALQHAHVLLGIAHVARRLVDELLQRMRSTHLQEAATVAVGVDVGNAAGAQLVRMGLHPFGRAEEPRLLAIPGAIDDRAVRALPGPGQLADGLGLGQECHLPADRVRRPVHPRVVMVAANDPLVGPLAAAQAGDHVVGGRLLPVELELEVHLRGAGSEVIGGRERPAPVFGRHRPAQRLEQRQRVGGRDRQHGDLRERLRLRAVQPLGARGGADAGRERIARVERHVRHRTALHGVRVAPAALGIDVALERTVLLRIGEDDAADRAVLGRDLGLDAAPGAAVAGQHDLALDVDAAPVELVVVLGPPVVHVHEIAGDVAVDRVGVVGRQLLAALARRAVGRERGLAERCGEARRRHHLEHARLRRGEQHVEALDRRVEAPRAEEPGEVVGVLLVVGRAQVVRPRAQVLHPLPQVVPTKERVESRFARDLRLGGRGAEPEQRKRSLGRDVGARGRGECGPQRCGDQQGRDHGRLGAHGTLRWG